MCQLINLHFRDSRVSLLLTRQGKQCKHPCCFRARQTLKTNSALAPQCGIGSFEISPESSSSDARSFPSSATSLTSHLSHTNRQQSCRSEPDSVSLMPSANRLPTPASPSHKHAHTRPQQPLPMLPFLDLLSLAFNSSGRLPSVPRLSTSGLPL